MGNLKDRLIEAEEPREDVVNSCVFDLIQALREAHSEPEPRDHRQLLLVAADALENQKQVIRNLILEVAKK
jgi:hypothetical protein